jgi:hypothetical protein
MIETVYSRRMSINSDYEDEQPHVIEDKVSCIHGDLSDHLLVLREVSPSLVTTR